MDLLQQHFHQLQAIPLTKAMNLDMPGSPKPILVTAHVSPLLRLWDAMIRHYHKVTPPALLTPLDCMIMRHGIKIYTSPHSKTTSLVFRQRWEVLMCYAHISDPFIFP